MPYAAPTRCPEPGCGVLTSSGRCDEHKRPAWQNPSAGWGGRGSTRAWRRRREQHLADNPFCAGVKTSKADTRGCGRVAEQADHILALADGGDLLTGPLQSFCEDCHKLKSQEDSRLRGISRARKARAARTAGSPEEVAR